MTTVFRIRKTSVVSVLTLSAVLSLTGCRLFSCGDTPHIVAKTADADRYAGLNAHFPAAFKFLRRNDLAQLAPGRYDIAGDDCYALIQEVKLKSVGEVNLAEAHKYYIDIQMPITAEETYGLVKTPDAELEKAGFTEKKDYVLFKVKTDNVTLSPGEFAVFFPPYGGHAPGLTQGAPRTIRKLVIKVRAR